MNRWAIGALLWFAATLYALFIKPPGSSVPPFAHFDKVAHFGLFYGQFWLLAKAFFSQGKAIPHQTLFTLAVAWALGSEFLQATLTSSRQGDIWDGLADVLGAGCALWLAERVAQAKQSSLSKE